MIPLQHLPARTLISVALAVCALGAGCRDPQADGTVLAVVQLDEAVRATCVRVEVLGADGAPVASTHFEGGRLREYRVAIYRGELAEQVELRAVALWGEGCDEPLAFNGQTAPVGARFVPGEVEEIALPLRAPDVALDADRDGFISTQHRGPDCNDANALAHPAATERCMGLEDLNCDGLVGCADPSCAGKVCAAPPVALAFVGETAPVTAGNCSSALVLESRDSFGNASPVSESLQVALSSTPQTSGLELFRDPECAQRVEALSLSGGETRVALHVRGTVVGPVQVSANAAGVAGATRTVEIVPAAPSALSFVTASRAPEVGACSERVEVESRDAFGNTSAVPMPLALALAAQPAMGVTFYADASCTTEAELVTINATTSRTGFHFRGTRPGPVQVNVSAVGLGEASQVQTVGLGPPTTLVFRSTPQALTTGECSSALTVQSLDDWENPSPPMQAVALALSAMPLDGVTFHAVAGCGDAPVTSVALPATTSEAAFYVRSVRPGTPTVRVQAPFAQATQGLTVQTGPAASVHFTSMPQTIAAGGCSSAIGLERRDAHGNPTVTGGPLAVTLGSMPSGVGFFSDGACSLPLGSQTVTLTAATGSVHVSGTIAGTSTLTANAAGLTGGTQALVINAGPPQQLVLGGVPQTLETGECSAQATLLVRDAFGNTVPAGALTAVSLTAVPEDDFEFFTDSMCAMPTTSLGIPGTATGALFHFRGIRPGTFEITTSANGLQPSQGNVTVETGPPARVRFVTAAQTLPVNQCSAEVRVELTDAFHNPSAVTSPFALTLSAVPSMGLTFYSDETCTTPATGVTVPAGASIESFRFRSTSVGQVQVTASGTGLTGDTQQHMIEQAAAALAFSSAPQTRWAGECSDPVTVQSRDAQGAPAAVISNTIVLLKGEPSTGFAFYADAQCTQPVNSVTILQNTDSATVHFKGLTEGAVTMTGESGSFSPASQTTTIRAASSGGSCTLAGGESEVSCPITQAVPDMNKTLLFYGATGNHAEPRRALARCFLESASNIRCTRGHNPGETISITWRSVYFPSGVQVRHVQSDCNSANNVTDVALSPPVGDVAQTFLLHGMDYGGNGYAQDVFATVELQSPSNVRITRHGGNCGNSPRYAVQVVEWTGAQVARGTLSGGIPNAALNETASGLPSLTAAEAARTFLLYTWRSNTGNMNGRMVRGSLPDASSALFERNTALADGVSAIHYERVTLPPGNVVHAVPVSMANSAASATGTFPAVDVSRASAFAGGMAIGGPVGGTGSQNNARPENMMARFTFSSPTEINATRARTEGAAAWTVWVVQFEP